MHEPFEESPELPGPCPSAIALGRALKVFPTLPQHRSEVL